MGRGLWRFVILVAELWGNPGIAAEAVVADGTFSSQATPAIGGNPSSGESIDAAGAAGSWRRVRPATATAGAGALAILHTADFERSDPRLAGLMLRCGRQGVEAVVVVVEPFPPNARPQITLRTPGQESNFVGTIYPKMRLYVIVLLGR